jgi:hypothetical protein
MLRLVKIAIVFNIVVCVLFVYGNYVQWSVFAGNNAASSNIVSCTWAPTQLTMMFYGGGENGVISAVEGLFVYPNLPFMLFWFSTIGNLLIIRQKFKG